MITSEIEESLIKELFEYSQRAILTPANLGIFQKGTKDQVIEILEQIDVNQLINLESRKEYDEWFDEIVLPFHVGLFPLFRENLVVSKGNPYSYSARLLTQYLKYLSTRTVVYYVSSEILIGLVHPIISNKYLRSFSDLGIKMVNQIENREQYYKVIKDYRTRLDMDLCEQNEALLEMDFGIEV
ncbi:hypothetical protein [Rhodohalobacter barkolensis]|uniref:Uncharacterized protein n=1 Tax=Rhodohalobacter barkolensis TaxID=2053187 RepID=A0A2N0VGY2_9BACT|nr:hypothetical protein [Rhodohalobacter barkolensis]PKD43462.1 hypothetical protein CWD77_07780 [Rhodohalobacter barkolensis]